MFFKKLKPTSDLSCPFCLFVCLFLRAESQIFFLAPSINKYFNVIAHNQIKSYNNKKKWYEVFTAANNITATGKRHEF